MIMLEKHTRFNGYETLAMGSTTCKATFTCKISNTQYFTFRKMYRALKHLASRHCRNVRVISLPPDTLIESKCAPKLLSLSSLLSGQNHKHQTQPSNEPHPAIHSTYQHLLSLLSPTRPFNYLDLWVYLGTTSVQRINFCRLLMLNIAILQNYILYFEEWYCLLCPAFVIKKCYNNI
jgi:hypothetical protein